MNQHVTPPRQPTGGPDDFLARLKAILDQMNANTEMQAKIERRIGDRIDGAAKIEQDIARHVRRYLRFTVANAFLFGGNTVAMGAYLIWRVWLP